MKLKKREYIKIVIHTCCIVALTLLFCRNVQYDLSNMPNFGAVQDMDITDFYNSVAEARDVAELDTNIVIVDVGLASRTQIAHALQAIDVCQPAAIGVDIIFRDVTDPAVDAELTETILSTLNIVVANDISGEGNSFYDAFVSKHNKGFANLGGRLDVVRKYSTALSTNTDTVYSFAYQLVRKSQKKHSEPAHAEESYIVYPSRKFYEIGIGEIEERAELLKGKIVLLGTLADNEDTHITPIDERMNGVKIHAYAIATMLSDKQIAVADTTVQWTIAVMVVCLLIFTRVYFLFTQNAAGDIIVRVVQLLLVWLFAYIGYKLYIDCCLYLDAPVVLLTCIGLLMVDVWEAIMVSVIWVKNRYLKKLLLP